MARRGCSVRDLGGLRALLGARRDLGYLARGATSAWAHALPARPGRAAQRCKTSRCMTAQLGTAVQRLRGQNADGPSERTRAHAHAPHRCRHLCRCTHMHTHAELPAEFLRAVARRCGREGGAPAWRALFRTCRLLALAVAAVAPRLGITHHPEGPAVRARAGRHGAASGPHAGGASITWRNHPTLLRRRPGGGLQAWRRWCWRSPRRRWT